MPEQIIKTEQDREQRTNLQNRAMWKFFTLLAETLNYAGLDQRLVLKPEVDIPWNKDAIHDQLWIPIQNAMKKGGSTQDMDTKDPAEIYEVLNRHLSEKFGVSVPWPSAEPPIIEER